MLKIDVNLGFSKQFIGFILILSMGCLSIISYIPILSEIKLLLGVLTIAYTAQIIWQHGLLKHPDSIIRLWQDTEGCQVLTNKQVISAEILGDSTVTAWVCVLRFKKKESKRTYSCVIFKDALEKEQYRRLLVFLRSY